MKSRVLPVCLVFFLSKVVCQTPANHPTPVGTLFDQFETVFYAKATALASSNVRDFTRLPFDLALRGLEELSKGESGRVLGKSYGIAVGTKDYLPPNGLGMVRSTFCYIIFLKQFEDINQYFKQPVASAVGVPIWQWTASLEEFGENEPKPSVLYVSELERSYLVISNDLQQLQNVITQLVSSQGEAARVSKTIPDWTDLGRHTFWGYRRYRHKEQPNRGAAGMQNITSAAQSLYLYADEGEKAGVLRLRSSTESDATADNLNATKMLPPFKKIGAGVWQSVVPLSFQDTDPDPVFAIAWLFGFGPVV